MAAGELTNVEILYRSDLKNKVFAPIPHTGFYVMGVYLKEADRWNLFLLELLTSQRKLIGENLRQDQAVLILSLAVRQEDPEQDWDGVDEDEGVEAVI